MSSRREAADLIHSAAIHLLRRVREIDASAMDLSPARASALSVLVFGGPSNLRQLADAEQVAPPTMTRIVAALRRGGYVRLTPSPDDARSSIVEATAKGTAALEKARTARLDLIDGLLSRNEHADVALLGKALAAIFPQAR
ncbi:MAG: MarR family transcriptional regulator [Candidatus Cybelea sp.]